MKCASPIVLVILLTLLFTSCGKEAQLTVKGIGMDYNAVVSLYPTANTSNPILVKSLKSEPQVYKVKLNKPGYGRLQLSADGDISFWIYLSDGPQDISFAAKDKFAYPVNSSSSKQGQEIINYYRLETTMLKVVTDSMRLAKEMLDNSNEETVIQAANNYNRWQDLKDKQNFMVIKEFARQNPASFFTLKMIEEDPYLGKNGKDYLKLLTNLGSEVKESEDAKKLIANISETSGREVGSKMAKVSGFNPSGKAYDPKILKKVNLFICWVSYDNQCRRNNVDLVALYDQFKNRDVEFIGISMDKHKKWWTTVIKDDKLAWPQYTDLLHAKSPNLGGLSPERMPYMFLTDKKGTILSQDLSVEGIALDLETHLKPQPSL
jgi:hypothetical protein